MNIKAYIICLAALFQTNLTTAENTDDLNLSAMIQPADSSLFVHDPNYFNWCNSIIKDDAGVYHLFYSRWPKKNSFYSWLTHSEIAHATSAYPDGPYTKAETILRPRPDNWDKITMHNVQVNKFGNKFYMYYISTHSGSVQMNDSILREIGLTGYSHKYWNLLRSNQRAGVAVASSLEGPWLRKDSPMIEPQKPIYTVAVNPSVCQGGDRRYYLIIKGDNAPSGRKHLIQAVGVSNSPEGPFHISEKPAFSDIPTEDVCIWYDQSRKRFYALFHAHGGNFIGLITSENGMEWQKATHYEVCKKQIPLKDGSVMKVDRMERPYMFLEDGKPAMLSFGVKKGNDSFIVFFRLK